jgi:hypothetical protein
MWGKGVVLVFGLKYSLERSALGIHDVAGVEVLQYV